jgi:biopolymer transport protein ExbB/TolQ
MDRNLKDQLWLIWPLLTSGIVIVTMVMTAFWFFKTKSRELDKEQRPASYRSLENSFPNTNFHTAQIDENLIHQEITTRSEVDIQTTTFASELSEEIK